MFGWREKRRSRERLDLLSAELFEAMKASEDEVEETALSPDLFARVQDRIASRRRRPSLNNNGRYRSYLAWATAAAAVVLALTFATRLTRTNQTTSAPELAATTPSVTPEPSPIVNRPAKELVSTPVVPAVATVASARKARRPRARSSGDSTPMLAELSEELQATEYLPLTLTPNERPGETPGQILRGDFENRQIVRLTLPRTTLVAFGVPMNMEHAGELVTADIMLGEDGVAHAIRFVH